MIDLFDSTLETNHNPTMPRCHVVVLLLACCAWLLARQTTDALQSVCGKDYESGQAPPIAFVASLKPVTDLTSADAIRQLNALRSWKSLHAATEVYVVGDDTAATLGDLVGAVRDCLPPATLYVCMPRLSNQRAPPMTDIHSWCTNEALWGAAPE